MPFNRLSRAAVLTMTAIMLFSATPILAQVTTHEPLIYRQCRRPPGLEWGRFPECGIDVALTDELQHLVRESTRPLLAEEETKINEHIELQFGTVFGGQQHADLVRVLAEAHDRLVTLLATNLLGFTDTERRYLEATADWISAQAVRYESTPFTTSDVRETRELLGDNLQRVHEIVRRRQREAQATLLPVENLVTRIDLLVARVGTALRDLAQEGRTIPDSVEQAYDHALELVRQSKRTCSTRRPSGCSELGEVLETIEAMREPLCSLRTDLRTFCE